MMNTLVKMANNYHRDNISNIRSLNNFHPMKSNIFTKEITCKFYKEFVHKFYRDFYYKIEGDFNFKRFLIKMERDVEHWSDSFL